MPTSPPLGVPPLKMSALRAQIDGPMITRVLELTCRPRGGPCCGTTGRVNVTEEAPELPGLLPVLSTLPAARATP
jgi:hypothetical protein